MKSMTVLGLIGIALSGCAMGRTTEKETMPGDDPTVGEKVVTAPSDMTLSLHVDGASEMVLKGPQASWIVFEGADGGIDRSEVRIDVPEAQGAPAFSMTITKSGIPTTGSAAVDDRGKQASVGYVIGGQWYLGESGNVSFAVSDGTISGDFRTTMVSAESLAQPGGSTGTVELSGHFDGRIGIGCAVLASPESGTVADSDDGKGQWSMDSEGGFCQSVKAELGL